jgi:hypothetical protein
VVSPAIGSRYRPDQVTFSCDQPLAEVVEQRVFLGHQHRVVNGKHRDAGQQPDPAGALRYRAQQDGRRGAQERRAVRSPIW